MFTIYASSSNSLAPFGIGEIIKSGFDSREQAEEYVLDKWGETAIQQIDIRDDDKQD